MTVVRTKLRKKAKIDKKSCQACRRVKPIEEFRINHKSDDGYTVCCKLCKPGKKRAYKNRAEDGCSVVYGDEIYC